MKTVKATLLALALCLIIALCGLGFIRDINTANADQIAKVLEHQNQASGVFYPELAVGFPPLAKRYLYHAIQPGTPMAGCVKLKLAGEIKLDGTSGWLPFTADQILAGGQGFVWTAKIRKSRYMNWQGADSYYVGKALSRFARFGIIPALSLSGPRLDQSAAGRLAIESLWLPSAFLPQNGARWVALDDERVLAIVECRTEKTTLTLALDMKGGVRNAVIDRYRDGELVPFGLEVDEETTINGFTIPSKVRAGWNYGAPTYDEVYRATVVDAQFL